MEKQYIIRKYVMANSIRDAIKKEKTIPADEAWINEDWLRNNCDLNIHGFKKPLTPRKN